VAWCFGYQTYTSRPEVLAVAGMEFLEQLLDLLDVTEREARS